MAVAWLKDRLHPHFRRLPGTGKGLQPNLEFISEIYRMCLKSYSGVSGRHTGWPTITQDGQANCSRDSDWHALSAFLYFFLQKDTNGTNFSVPVTCPRHLVPFSLFLRASFHVLNPHSSFSSPDVLRKQLFL